MKYLLVLCLAISLAGQTFSQNGPVPDYLATAQFPDSVRSLGLLALNGTRLTFGELVEKCQGKKVLIDIWVSRLHYRVS